MAETRLIKLADLSVSGNNVRTGGLDKSIDILMESIMRLGLIEPITVTPGESGQHTILVGQRRFHAYNKLNRKFPGQGFDEIECLIREAKDDGVSKASSLAENLTSLPMQRDDLIEAVTDLFIRSGATYKKVTETYGITKHIVDKYVGLSRLPQGIRDAIRKGRIHHKQKTAEGLALKAVDAFSYTPDGKHGEEKIVEFARVLGTGDADVNTLIKVARMHPDKTVDQLVERANANRKVELKLHMDTEQDSVLGIYADRHSHETKEEAALGIILERLAEEEDSL